MKSLLPALFCSLAILTTAGCQSAQSQRLATIKAAVAASGIDAVAAKNILGRIQASPDRFFSLFEKVRAEMVSDPGLLRRADKGKGLPPSFVPADLVNLDGTSLSVSRPGHRLRKPAFDALVAMSRAAKAEGVSLLVSSAYRSYEYQKSVFARNVAEMGEKEALRVSAPPGASQHQLGTAMDFGSITDTFAETAAGKWLTFNAASFGFSLSFPKDMEAVTGYRWESWHYRFIGKDAVTLQNEYFGGIQQYLMLFLDALPPER